MGEVVNANAQAIIALPIVNGSNSTRVHEFYEKMVMHVQSLGTINGKT